MFHWERSRDDVKVFSLEDKIVVIYGTVNPMVAPGIDAPKGTMFIQQPPGTAADATFWIKKGLGPTEWDTWDAGNITGVVVIPPSNTKNIDSFPVSQFSSANYLIDVDNGVSKSQTFNINCKVKGSSADYSRYGKVGVGMNFSINISSDGVTYTFDITNNESSAITVKYERLAI